MGEKRRVDSAGLPFLQYEVILPSRDSQGAPIYMRGEELKRQSAERDMVMLGEPTTFSVYVRMRV